MSTGKECVKNRNIYQDRSFEESYDKNVILPRSSCKNQLKKGVLGKEGNTYGKK